MSISVHLVVMLGQNQAVGNTSTPHSRQSRWPRQFKQRWTLDSFTEAESLQNFRFSKAAILQLYKELKEQIECRSRRSQALPGLTKLIAVLHYFASGTFQYCISSKLGFTQPTFSRSLRQIVGAIVSLSGRYIRFPYQPEERVTIKAKFFEKFGIPLTIGLIDCTHVAIIPPAAHEPSYRNRKMFHSINVQVICGPSGEILDIVARYPGGTHDSYILSCSGIGDLFQSGYFGEDLLLGDNGYRLTPWLLTPFLNPQNESQQQFNYAHRRTRSQVERVFGQLKSRFHCLDVTGGAMLYEPILVTDIILCCAVLHNLALMHNLPIEIASDLREPIDCTPLAGNDSSLPGVLKRNEIARNFF